MKTSVSLVDADLATLVDSTDPEVRTAAAAASARLASPSRWPSVAPHVARLIADVIAEAKAEGRLIFQHTAVSYCRYCEVHSTWQKSKRRRKDYEAKLSGIEFARRFITIASHIAVGGCRACVDEALLVLRAELAAFPVELPQALLAEGAPTYRRWDRCRCKKCEWIGHDGQLGKLRTVMGDGYYQGKCPSCGAERRFLGPDPFEHLDGFDVVEERAA